jgi:hypothetical protein
MRSLLLVLQLLAVMAPAAAARQDTEFGRLVARLSENGGFFDSDNLVSNETSYLHVIPALKTLKVQGGAYLGVGPEQNFSYLAEIKPDIAILIDIRRDNMLLHLLFRAMFTAARNRLDYLCLLYGRPAPRDLDRWNNRPLDQLLAYVDRTPGDSALHDLNHTGLMGQVEQYGVPLTPLDRQTLRRFHNEFFGAGLELRYTSLGRGARPGYPSERQLYLSTDLGGHQVSYLSTEKRFRVVRDLERGAKVIPVVGDLSGPAAMRAIAAYLKEIRRDVTAMYVSNVEMYLFRQGNFGRFADNVRSLPTSAGGVIMRSYFGRGGMMMSGGLGEEWPQPLPGHLSAQILQPLSAFLAATARGDSVTYRDILVAGAVDLQTPRRPR